MGAHKETVGYSTAFSDFVCWRSTSPDEAPAGPGSGFTDWGAGAGEALGQSQAHFEVGLPEPQRTPTNFRIAQVLEGPGNWNPHLAELGCISWWIIFGEVLGEGTALPGAYEGRTPPTRSGQSRTTGARNRRFGAGACAEEPTRDGQSRTVGSPRLAVRSRSARPCDSGEFARRKVPAEGWGRQTSGSEPPAQAGLHARLCAPSPGPS